MQHRRHRRRTRRSCSSEVGGSGAFLLNVCSYPSGSPARPSDCVVTPNAGFLTIVKIATRTMTRRSSSTPPLRRRTGACSGRSRQRSQQFIPYVPTTDLDLNEVVPAGWRLDSASCALQTATPTADGDANRNRGRQPHHSVRDRDDLYVHRHGAGAGAERGEVVVDVVDHGGGSGGAVHVHGHQHGQPDVDGCDGLRSELHVGDHGPTGDTNGDGQLQLTETWVYTSAHGHPGRDRQQRRRRRRPRQHGHGRLDETGLTPTASRSRWRRRPGCDRKTVVEVDADTTSPFLVDAAGDVISYSIVVTNTGNRR